MRNQFKLRNRTYIGANVGDEIVKSERVWNIKHFV